MLWSGGMTNLKMYGNSGTIKPSNCPAKVIAFTTDTEHCGHAKTYYLLDFSPGTQNS